MDIHRSEKVQAAIEALESALCEWERTTLLQSVLILREQGGFERVSVSGKPFECVGISDESIFETNGIEPKWKGGE